jgi:hypothetical protein
MFFESNEIPHTRPPQTVFRSTYKWAGITGLLAVVAVTLSACGWWPWSSVDIAEFGDGVGGYAGSTNDLSQLPDDIPNVKIREIDGDTVIEATGRSAFIRLEAIEIDPSKTYKVSARLRVLTDDPAVGGAITSVGVATFDQDGTLEKTPPGWHRLAAMRGRLIKSGDGWVIAEGMMTGTGNESDSQFREGTRTVRPLVVLNEDSPQAVSQVAYLRFEEVR